MAAHIAWASSAFPRRHAAHPIPVRSQLRVSMRERAD